MSAELEDVVYDRLAASICGGCCADRRKPCVEHVMYLDGAKSALMAPEVQSAWRDAERLRNLAAMFDGHPNRDQQTYRGAEIAAMLRGDG